jgi:predicted nucleotidyltransferase
MVRRKDINDEINGYLLGLEELGYPVNKAYVFGSMVNGHPHAYSDIDLAVWSENFGSNYFEIIEKTAVLKRKFKRIELHPFQLNDSAENNPFIRTIEASGKRVIRGMETV